MATKKQPTKRGQSTAARKNQEVDDLDLASQFNSLPPAADASLSPLAANMQETAFESADDGDSPPAADAGSSRSSGSEQSSTTPPPAADQAGTDEPYDQPTGRRGQRQRSTRRSRSSSPSEVEQARKNRDEERERLVREALEKLGRDPAELTPKPLPKGGKHRPTIELSPDEYAAINIANAVRPDLFDTTLVGFVRACARNWERIAVALEEGQPGPLGSTVVPSQRD